MFTDGDPSGDELASVMVQLVAYFRQRSPHCDAEDLAANTVARCVRAWQRGQKVRMGYVYSAARSVLVDWQRRQHGVPVYSLEELVTDPSYEMADPEELPAWFDQLSDSERETLALRVAGHDNTSIATLRGEPRKRVWVRLRGVRKLVLASAVFEGALETV